jgi:microcystin-dependent protein
MALDTPTWLQNGTYSARLDRIFADVLFTEGVMQVGTGQLLVSQRGAGANNSVDIAAGYACITGDDTADQGKYLVRNTAVVNLAASAAPVANSRIDLVCMRINDPAAGGPSGNNAQFVYVVGVAAGSPVPPATPTSAIALARVLRTVGDTSVVTANITDVRSQSLTVFSNTLTNAGDLLSFDGANLTRVALGTTGLPLVAGATSVGYAQVDTVGIASSAVTEVKLANASVSLAKMQSNSVDSSKIVDGSIAVADLAAAVINLLAPAGSLMPYIGSVAPAGWLLHNQTVVGADALYPALWAVAPAGWKSGSNLAIPNLADTLVAQTGGSAAALGVVGGSMTTTIAEANLPPHAHGINHDHGSVTSSTESADHSHSGTTSLNGDHEHGADFGLEYILQTSGGGGSVFASGSGVSVNSSTTTANNGTHSHTMTTGGISANHTHSVDLPNFVGNSLNGAGTSTAMTTRPRHLGVNIILKAH